MARGEDDDILLGEPIVTSRRAFENVELRSPDSDGDGLTDAEEASFGTNPTKVDTDGDGLSDRAELGFGTNPLKSDSDGDGLTDAEEVGSRTNPLDSDTNDDGIPDGGSVVVTEFDSTGAPRRGEPVAATKAGREGFSDVEADLDSTAPTDSVADVAANVTSISSDLHDAAAAVIANIRGDGPVAPPTDDLLGVVAATEPAPRGTAAVEILVADAQTGAVADAAPSPVDDVSVPAPDLVAAGLTVDLNAAPMVAVDYLPPVALAATDGADRLEGSLPDDDLVDG